MTLVAVGSGDSTEAMVTATFNFLDEEDESDDEDEPFDTKVRTTRSSVRYLW